MPPEPAPRKKAPPSAVVSGGAPQRPGKKRAALGLLIVAGLAVVASGAAFGGDHGRSAAPRVNGSTPPPAPVAPPPAPVTTPPPPQCPEDMVLVEGSYCTDVRQDCQRWLDEATLPFARCAEYSRQSRCVGKRVPMRFCIDRREYTPPGETLPQNWASYESAGQTCARLGKRLCTDNEWNFACEGEEMLPYPYGYERRPVCNQDRTDLFEKNPKLQVLRDLREPSDGRPECKSPFGVENMVGNLDEPVAREGFENNQPFRNALKGGWWMPARNRCRPATTAHDDHYKDIQIGVRCCGAASDSTSPAVTPG